MLHDFNRKDADEILPDKVIQLLEQQAQSASQMQELQSQLMKAEAQLEQAKGQAEIEVSKANVQDIIARAQERIARIRMDLQAGVADLQLKSQQIKKAVVDTDAVDVASFNALNQAGQEEMNGTTNGRPAPVPGRRAGDTGPPPVEYEEDTGMGGFEVPPE
jgi:multidrug efflux pump subunit AcrA (membrane-fusion protein)